MAQGNELNGEGSAAVLGVTEPNGNGHAFATPGRRLDNSAFADAIPRLPGTSQWQMSKIAIKCERKVLFINPSEVFSVVAQGNYVVLEEESGSYRLLESISNIAEKLRPYGFIRIHRSRVVNSSWVEASRPCANGGYLVCLKGGREYAVTKSYKKNLKSVAGVWLGNNESERW